MLIRHYKLHPSSRQSTLHLLPSAVVTCSWVLDFKIAWGSGNNLYCQWKSSKGLLQKFNVNVYILKRSCHALMWLGNQGYWILVNPVIIVPILIWAQKAPSEIGVSQTSVVVAPNLKHSWPFTFPLNFLTQGYFKGKCYPCGFYSFTLKSLIACFVRAFWCSRHFPSPFHQSFKADLLCFSFHSPSFLRNKTKQKVEFHWEWMIF